MSEGQISLRKASKFIIIFNELLGEEEIAFVVQS
jgi:hypothetical protein